LGLQAKCPGRFHYGPLQIERDNTELGTVTVQRIFLVLLTVRSLLETLLEVNSVASTV